MHQYIVLNPTLVIVGKNKHRQMHMKHTHKTSKNVVRKTMTALLLFFLIFNSLHILFDGVVLAASSENIEWSATIRVTESSGNGDDVIFGEAPNASDGQDDYDKIKPPFPPQFPFLLIRFDTNLDNPYDKLWYDYKQYPDEYKVWNLSIMWMSEPGNKTITTIDILWDKTEVGSSEYDSVLLHENNAVVADMLVENSYTFNSSDDMVHHFQIICQSKTSITNKSLFISIIFIPILLIIFTLYYKMKKN